LPDSFPIDIKKLAWQKYLAKRLLALITNTLPAPSCWQTIPLIAVPIIATIASVIALIAAAYFRSYYLCIPAGIGVLSTLYCFKKLKEARHLQSLSISSERFQSENNRLQVTTYRLERSNQQLERQLEAFQVDLGRLQVQIQDLEKQKRGLEQANDQLKALFQVLDTKLLQLAETTDKMKQLEPCVERLHQASLDFSSQQNDFRADVQALNLNLSQLHSLRLTLQSTQFSTYLSAHARLHTEIQLAQENLSQCNEQARLQKNQILSLEGIKHELEQQVGQLRRTHQDLLCEVNRLTLQINRLEDLSLSSNSDALNRLSDT
jgi:chromosome segregation ATPase